MYTVLFQTGYTYMLIYIYLCQLQAPPRQHTPPIRRDNRPVDMRRRTTGQEHDQPRDILRPP